MKKVLAILLAISVLALSACAAKQVNSDTQKDSNTAETEQKPGSEQTEQPAQEAKRVEPLAESLDLNALTDATVAASFGAAGRAASAQTTFPKPTAKRSSR